MRISCTASTCASCPTPALTLTLPHPLSASLQALGQEFQRLRQYAHAVDDSHFRQPGRRGGAVARMAVRLLRGLL